MDTIIFSPAQPDSRIPEIITPFPAVGEVGAATLDELCDIASHSAADAPLLSSAPDDTWARLGAKPKAAASSTPFHPERWARVGVNKGKRCSPLFAPAPAPAL